ncbi:translation elongation factor Ts [Helicobacter cetorum]|uniref:translation elongation factor Ts n=1 Tax=Helicobacter cetorum TaxID=138563 RepID=UPI000CF0BF98|nr:translation elongation factor Ts [Helicobacter cetorum]
MAEINAQLVKQLRDLTDAGMMDCKKALVEVDGDLQKAIDFLREKGLSKAAKKADRVAAEGVVALEVASDFKSAVMVEINSETDFVAKNEGFKELVKKTLETIKTHNTHTTEELHQSTLDNKPFEEYLRSQIAVIGENILVRKIANFKAGDLHLINGYAHSNARVGVLITMKYNNENNAKKVAELARNIAMHAAAMKPQVLDCKDFSLDFVKKETLALIAEIEKENEEAKRLGKPLKNIPTFGSSIELSDEVLANQKKAFENELKEQGKPEQIWDKIVPGKMERFIADNTLIDQRLTLLGQFYVMDDKKTIAQVVADYSKELNDSLEITEYVRFELGEGIEKKVENFAEEVALQMK